jgi:hypothetical protein
MKRTVIILSLIFALAIALSASIPTLAAPTDTTVVSGTVKAAIDVTSPATVSVGDLIPPSASTSADQTVTVKCNKPGWSLAAEDMTVGVNKGHMLNGGTALINHLTIEGGDQVAYAPLSAAVPIEDGTGAVKGTTTITGITFQQTADWEDVEATYSITVTFTGTVN